MEARLTQIVKVGVYPVRTWNRAHQPGFVEGAPLVDQDSLAPCIILEGEERTLLDMKLTRERCLQGWDSAAPPLQEMNLAGIHGHCN